MSFPGKVIENLWFVSLSCLRTQVLVRVPNFLWIYFWKMSRRLRAGLDRARDVPIGFQVQRLNHSSCHSSIDIIRILMEFNSVRGLFFACIIVRFFCWGLSWWSFPNAVAYMSFPGKVIENLWFVSLSCLRTQVLVRVPNFFWIYFWKWDRRLRAGLDRARDVPIGFQVQRLNHWVIIDILTLFVFWWNLIPSVDYFLLALLFDFLLRIVVVVVSKRCRLHVLSRKSNWESLVRQSQLLASTSIGSCSQLLPNIFLKKKIERCEQGSNLRGKFPLDFKSNALTTRPSQLFWHYSYFDGI